MDYRLLSLLVGLCGCLFSLSGCQSADNATAADTFIITTILTTPYVIMKDDGGEGGEPMYEGYLVDMFEHLNKEFGFAKYKFVPVADGKYGNFDSNTGQWTGMIGEVSTGKADAAVAPLSITDKRKTVVVFTKPFMNVDASILIRKDLNIKSLEELMNNSKVLYGCIDSGRTHSVFMTAKSGVLQEMNGFMTSQDPSVYVETTKIGVDRALTTDYALIGESTTLDYMASLHCELTTIPLSIFPSVGYGIALDKNGRFTSQFNAALLNLHESGTLQELYNKWWDVDQSKCMDDDDLHDHEDHHDDDDDLQDDDDDDDDHDHDDHHDDDDDHHDDDDDIENGSINSYYNLRIIFGMLAAFGCIVLL